MKRLIVFETKEQWQLLCAGGDKYRNTLSKDTRYLFKSSFTNWTNSCFKLMNLRNKWATHESNAVQSMNNLRWADEISAEILCITRDLNINMSIFCWWCRQFWSVFQNCFWSEATGAVKNLYRIWWLTHEAIFCFFFASFGLFRLSRYFPLYWYQSFREMGNLPEKLFSYISIDFYFVAATFMVHFLVFLRNDSGDEDLWTKLEFNNCQWHDAFFKLSSLKQRQLTYSDRNQKKKKMI